ncbi:hypothetical protein Rcae01_05185 [Novipirellula caenicola]|uniref:Uncharacterized protein n=1 Tax=Novipirellula caenicola TaxID=1536901 RepID=A0ABP9VX19_9BACT
MDACQPVHGYNESRKDFSRRQEHPKGSWFFRYLKITKAPCNTARQNRLLFDEPATALDDGGSYANAFFIRIPQVQCRLRW